MWGTTINCIVLLPLYLHILPEFHQSITLKNLQISANEALQKKLLAGSKCCLTWQDPSLFITRSTLKIGRI